jgi:hypothetical protein
MTMRHPQDPLSTRQIFSVPLVLYALTAVGLCSALLGDGAWDVLSWATLSAPVAAVAWALRRPG